MEEEVAKLIPCLVLSCLQHTDAHFYFKDQLSNLWESDMFESISDSVMHFYIAYDAEFKGIIEKVFEDPQFMKSKRRFLAKIGIRCLKMSEDPTFSNFLLMCAFVGHVASFCYTNGKCYRVLENACKCAIAVYKRKFLELFNQRGGVNGLYMYSDFLNEIVLDLQDHYADLKDILSPDLEGKQRVLSLLNACKDVDSTEYVLTEFERKLLYKVTKKELRKLKPSLDNLIRRIPRKYFQMRRNQDSQNPNPNVFCLNLLDIESSGRERCSLGEYHYLLSPCSNSSIMDSYSLPIDYTLKKYSQPSNRYIVEKQSEASNCCISQKQSEPSNCCIIEKRYEPPNSCIIEKQYKPSTCCIIEKEFEPLNYCITERVPELSNKETILGRSPSLVYHRMNRKEIHSMIDETQTANKELKFTTQDSRRLKHSHSLKPIYSELSKLEDRTRSVESPHIKASPVIDDVSICKRRKICNSPQGKLFPVTDYGSSQKQSVPSNHNSPEKPMCLSMRVSSCEDTLPNTKRSSFEVGSVPSKKSIYELGMPSDEDNGIEKYRWTSFTNWNYLQFQHGAKEEPPLASKDYHLRTPGNISPWAQEQYLSRFHQPPTHCKVTPASYSSNNCAMKQNLVSICSLSNESSSSSIQRSSEGYFTGESPISDVCGNEEIQSVPYAFHSSFLTSSDSSPTENEEFYADWAGDTTLKSLRNHKCFHCGTKCFNYIMYIFQQFTSHFLD